MWDPLLHPETRCRCMMAFQKFSCADVVAYPLHMFNDWHTLFLMNIYPDIIAEIPVKIIYCCERLKWLTQCKCNNMIWKTFYTPRFNKVERGVYWFYLVRLSVCGQNCVRSVSSTILVRSILYLQILSSNFRRCVARKVCFKIQKFGQILVTLTLSSFDLGSNITQ